MSITSCRSPTGVATPRPTSGPAVFARQPIVATCLHQLMVRDVGHRLLDRQVRLGVVLDPLRVVQEVPIGLLEIIRFRDHQAVAAVGGQVVRSTVDGTPSLEKTPIRSLVSRARLDLPPAARARSQARRGLLQRADPQVPPLHRRRRRPLPSRTAARPMDPEVPALPARATESMGASRLPRHPHPHHRTAANDGTSHLGTDLANRNQRRRTAGTLAVPQPERVRRRTRREISVHAAQTISPTHADLPLPMARHPALTRHRLGFRPDRPPRSTSTRIPDSRQSRRTEAPTHRPALNRLATGN